MGSPSFGRRRFMLFSMVQPFSASRWRRVTCQPAFCSSWHSRRPTETEPTLERVMEEESKLDVEALVAEALEGVERITLG